MRCPSCDTHYPDGVPCCTRCGVEFHWEHKDSIVQLGELNANTPNREARFQEIVGRHLHGVGQSGWQADGPTDWETLLKEGQIALDKEPIAGGPPVEQFHRATLRLRRLHIEQREDPAGHGPPGPDPGPTPDESAGQLRTG